MPAVNLIFPHQLFESSEILKSKGTIYLVEEFLFFKQYNFHKQKIAFHRASMKAYEAFLIRKKRKVIYIDSKEATSDVRKLIPLLKKKGITTVHFIDPTDNYLSRRLKTNLTKYEIDFIEFENPLFLNTREDLSEFFKPTKKKFFQTTFYKQQRTRRNILLDTEGKPQGGKWSFDAENRKKYPKGKTPPPIHYPEASTIYSEAISYTEKHFAKNIGTLGQSPLYPIDFKASKIWLNQFLEHRFHEFGTYEDAIVKEYSILNHSVLTPMLNTGLLTPSFILETALYFAESNDVPINSTEGFVRQIIGWREFIRGIYEVKSVEERTKNFWNFKRKIPASFYDGTTGIQPIDDCIHKLLKTGYNHHIERLMILGNFMVLCEFNPDEVYRWFMELYIDAYDWVMVPNVYGMSQFADGGLMSTKPYISGSNYVLKMSNYKKGPWQETWDGLFWRFLDKHRDFFLKNPRLGMLVRTFDKMDDSKKKLLLENGETYLKALG